MLVKLFENDYIVHRSGAVCSKTVYRLVVGPEEAEAGVNGI